MSSTAHIEQASPKDDFEVQQEEIWREAAEGLTAWSSPENDDYDFGSWTKKASEELLNAGCLYEYARESHKFRCRLVLLSRGPVWTEYQGNSAGFDHLAKSGWEGWLENFADELIANKTFAEVWQKNSDKVKKSLGALDTYCLYPKAVELPGRHIITHGDGQPEFGYPGSQVFQIEVCWRHYDNKEIGEEMKRLAVSCRPPNEKGPQRTGKKRESKVRSDLKALSVMRIWKLHERNPWKRLAVVANVCRYSGCVKEAKAYKRRCKEGHGDEAMSKAAKAEMTRARRRALSLFRCWFPWGKPANY